MPDCFQPKTDLRANAAKGRSVPIVWVHSQRGERRQFCGRALDPAAQVERGTGWATTRRFGHNNRCDLTENGPEWAANGLETWYGGTARAAVIVDHGKKIAEYRTMAYVLRTYDGW